MSLSPETWALKQGFTLRELNTMIKRGEVMVDADGDIRMESIEYLLHKYKPTPRRFTRNGRRRSPLDCIEVSGDAEKCGLIR